MLRSSGFAAFWNEEVRWPRSRSWYSCKGVETAALSDRTSLLLQGSGNGLLSGTTLILSSGGGV